MAAVCPGTLLCDPTAQGGVGIRDRGSAVSVTSLRECTSPRGEGNRVRKMACAVSSALSIIEMTAVPVGHEGN